MEEEKSQFEKNPRSPRGSLTLLSIHGESHMNTYQGGRSRRRNKSLGYVCVMYHKQFLSNNLLLLVVTRCITGLSVYKQSTRVNFFNHFLLIVAAIGKTFNGYYISKVSTCILKPDVILQKKIDKKIRNLKNIVLEFT